MRTYFNSLLTGNSKKLLIFLVILFSPLSLFAAEAMSLHWDRSDWNLLFSDLSFWELHYFTSRLSGWL